MAVRDDSPEEFLLEDFVSAVHEAGGAPGLSFIEDLAGLQEKMQACYEQRDYNAALRYAKQVLDVASTRRDSLQARLEPVLKDKSRSDELLEQPDNMKDYLGLCVLKKWISAYEEHVSNIAQEILESDLKGPDGSLSVQ
ncbi:hypothetical protein JW826_06080 [Candidatus Woesearchaeota archaeon]|nr:hypothetical protein [Candidatus Woesearchaeota archaeon]